MIESRRGRFLLIALGTLAVALPVSTLYSPPDAFTRSVVAVGVVMFVLPIANLLSHPTVYEWLRGN